MAMITYKFKLYSAKRNKKLSRQIDIAATVWNHTIALQRKYYKATGRYASANRVKKLYTKLKKLPRFASWNEIGSQALQDVVERIDRSYKAFFDYRTGKTSQKRGVPHFRKRSKYNSFTLKQAGYKLLEDERTIVIGKQHYKYHKSREITGTIKTVTVKRTAYGAFFIYIVCNVPTHVVLPRTGKAVGMDFGLKDFLTLDDGTRVSSPLWYKQSLPLVHRANRKLSRCKAGSNHRRAAKAALARLHDRIANRRRDWFHKQAHSLCACYATICIEDLNIKAMQHLWGRKVSDLAFSEFVGVLEDVAAKTGTTVIKIDRWYPSSKTCNVCGYIYNELNLKEREWTCTCCGTHHDRDVNAALNIRNVALSNV